MKDLCEKSMMCQQKQLQLAARSIDTTDEGDSSDFFGSFFSSETNEQAHAADKVGTVVGGSSSTTSTPNLLQHDEICRVLHNAVRESIIF